MPRGLSLALRGALLAALLLIDLLLLAYLSRSLWSDRLLSAAGGYLQEEFGLGVQAADLRGGLFHRLELRRLDLTTAAGIEVRGAAVQADYSLWGLLQGDLEALSRLEIQAQSLHLRGAESGSGSNGPDLEALLDALRLLPSGARIRVRDCSLMLADRGRLEGPLDVELMPRATSGARRAHLSFAGFAATVDLDPGGRWAIDGRGREPSRLLDLLGIEHSFQEGALDLHASGSLRNLNGSGELRLTQMEHPEGRGDASLEFRIDPQELMLGELQLDLPGIQLWGEGLRIPVADFSLARCRGRLALEIRELESRRQRLPDQLRPLLPIHGSFRAWLAEGSLTVSDGNLRARGLSLDLRGGQLPLSATDWRRVSTTQSIGVTVALEPDALQTWLPDLNAPAMLRGDLTGSLDSPRVRGQIDLGAGGFRDVLWSRARGQLAYTGNRLSLEELEVEGLQPSTDATTAQPGDLGDLTGRIEVDWSVDTATRFDLQARLQPRWLELAGLEPRWHQRLSTARLRTSGSLRFAEGPTALPQGRVSARVDEVLVDGANPLAADLAFRIDPQQTLQIERLLVTGVGELEATGALALADGSAPIDLQVRSSALELGFVTALFAPAPLDGRIDLSAQLSGTRDDPRGTLEIRGELADALGQLEAYGLRWPEELGHRPAAPLSVQARADGNGAGEIRITSLGAEWASPDASLTLAGEGRLPWDLARSVVVDVDAQDALRMDARLEVGSRVATLDLDCFGSTATAELAIQDPRSGTLSARIQASGIDRAPQDWRSVAIAGDLNSEQLELRSLVPESEESGLLRGILSGEASLAGTLGDPRPELALRLADGRIKLAGLPTLENLQIALRANRREVVVRECRAELGGAQLQLGGTVRSRADEFLTDPEDLAVDLRLRGQDVLLARSTGIKVRGDVDIQARGESAEIVVGGEIVVDGKYTRRISLLPDLSGRGGGGAGGSSDRNLLEGAQLPPALGDRLRYDVKIRTREPFELRTNVLDVDMNAELALLGSGSAPYLEGGLQGTDGTLRLPAMFFNVDSVLITFDSARPNRPQLLARASGRRQSIQVNVSAEGSLGAPSVLLSSVPPLPRDELVVLLSTGVLPARLREQGARGRAQLVGSYLAQELLDFYFGSDSTETQSFAERIRIESGREISDEGVETIMVEFDLSDIWTLQAERDIYEDYNMGLVYRIRW